MTRLRLWQTAIMTAALGLAAIVPAVADEPVNFDEHTLYALSPEPTHGDVRLDAHREHGRRRVHLEATNGFPGQLWHIRQSDRGTWVFGSPTTGDCDRLTMSDRAGEEHVVMRPKDRSSAQNWFVRRTAAHPHLFRLTSERTGLALSAMGPGQDGVDLVPSAPDPAQRWIVRPVRQVDDNGACPSL